MAATSLLHRKRVTLPRPAIDAIKQSLNEGVSGVVLARLHGVAPSTISRIKKSGKKYKRLLPAEVEVIKQALSNGERGTSLAARYGVSDATISHIKSGKKSGSAPADCIINIHNASQEERKVTMKDYSNHKTKYGIIDYRGMFAIVKVNERSIDDESEIVSHKPDTLSFSKSITTLQGQINEMIERESTPMVSGLERWKEAKIKQRRVRRQITTKVEAE